MKTEIKTQVEVRDPKKESLRQRALAQINSALAQVKNGMFLF